MKIGGILLELPDLSDLNLSEKEQKILLAAINVFSEKGFSAATTSEIAKNAGVAEGTIFRYFKTKKDILRGILIQTINIVSRKFFLASIEKILLQSEKKDLHTILKELLYDRIKLVESIFPMAKIVITEALFHEDLREALYENILKVAIDIFDSFRLQMIQKGFIKSDIKSEVFLRSVLGNMGALIVQRQLFGDKFLIEDLDKELDTTIDVILSGISSNVN